MCTEMICCRLLNHCCRISIRKEKAKESLLTGVCKGCLSSPLRDAAKITQGQKTNRMINEVRGFPHEKDSDLTDLSPNRDNLSS